MPDISVVVPVYNSAGCLKELTRRVHKTLQKDYELILVNDQSLDNSWDVIHKLVREYDTVIGINLRKNSGQDNALMAGLRQSNGDYVVIMDDDLQHAPEDIIKLYEQCQKGFDICFANFDQNSNSQEELKSATIKILLKKQITGALLEIKGPFKIYDPYNNKLLTTSSGNKRYYIYPYSKGLGLFSGYFGSLFKESRGDGP